MDASEQAEIDELTARHIAASHAMQSGVKCDHESGGTDGAPKHLRTGINVALCDHASLVRLLIEKGLISKVEYYRAITEGMEAEKARYEELLAKKLGAPVALM